MIENRAISLQITAVVIVAVDEVDESVKDVVGDAFIVSPPPMRTLSVNIFTNGTVGGSNERLEPNVIVPVPAAFNA
jgi:hypothetical protein